MSCLPVTLLVYVINPDILGAGLTKISIQPYKQGLTLLTEINFVKKLILTAGHGVFWKTCLAAETQHIKIVLFFCHL